MRKLIFILLLTPLFSTPVQSQQIPAIQFQPEVDSPIGKRNPNAPEELSQFDFLIGDWNIEIDFRQPDGAIQTYPAIWHNHWMVNGILLAQEWRGPFATGVEFKRYNKQKGMWEGRQTYNFKPGWSTSIAVKEEDKMIVTHGESTDQAGRVFILRETYHDMTENSFKMFAQRSYDNGKTWSEWAFKMVCNRVD